MTLKLTLSIAVKYLQDKGFMAETSVGEAERFVMSGSDIYGTLSLAGDAVALRFFPPAFAEKLKKESKRNNTTWVMQEESELLNLLTLAAPLAREWRDIQTFAPENDPPTETERLIQARRGQQLYREKLEKLWQGCAVTGITCRELLRASHARAWSECTSAAERLDPYNGFLLNAALDALFDQYLISFDDNGSILISPALSKAELAQVGVTLDQHLRQVFPQNLPYLKWHRERFFERIKQNTGGVQGAAQK